MAIPVGKLVLYSAGAGIHPSLCLPVSLDAGTDNSALLEDPLYLGHHSRRLRGAAYDSFVEEFVQSVKSVFPRAVLQWEDFKKANAFRLLERYAARLPSFNDDIQGTAAVTLAGLLCGLGIIGQSLRDQRFLLVGAGAAGVGIGRLLRSALADEGVIGADARQRLIFFDSKGVLHEDRPELDTHKREFALQKADLAALGLTDAAPSSLEELIRALRATALIGTTGQSGDFTPAVIGAMAAQCERPLIALSNPTSKAECTPSEAIQYSEGRALVATGSPFEPVAFRGRKFGIGQCNNVFIFPGVGLGALISEASRITDSMFLAAARTLAEFTHTRHSGDGALYPSLSDLREVSRLIAARVAQTARDEGLGRGLADAEIEAAIEKFSWLPDYNGLAKTRLQRKGRLPVLSHYSS